MSKTIGEVLKEARVKMDLTADDVAAACNVSRSRVYQWEANEYVFPKNLKTLSAVLHIPMRRLKSVNASRPRQAA